MDTVALVPPAVPTTGDAFLSTPAMFSNEHTYTKDTKDEHAGVPMDMHIDQDANTGTGTETEAPEMAAEVVLTPLMIPPTPTEGIGQGGKSSRSSLSSLHVNLPSATSGGGVSGPLGSPLVTPTGRDEVNGPSAAI
jgi:hypothetical protein